MMIVVSFCQWWGETSGCEEKKKRADADKYIIFSLSAARVIMLFETGLIYYVPSTLRKLSLGARDWFLWCREIAGSRERAFELERTDKISKHEKLAGRKFIWFRRVEKFHRVQTLLTGVKFRNTQPFTFPFFRLQRTQENIYARRLSPSYNI